jgi:hypothetical protein
MSRYLTIFLIGFVSSELCGQGTNATVNPGESDTVWKSASIVSSAIGTTNSTVPFWMRANQHGSIPLYGISSSVIGSAYIEEKKGHFGWGGGISSRLNIGYAVKGILLEAYAKARYKNFQVTVGRTLDQEGLVDSVLSSGSFSLSKNALGVPKIEIRIPKYWYVFNNRWISFKGDFSFGLAGKQPILLGQRAGENVETYLHHMTLYVRLARLESKFRLYGAINHDVLFGNDRYIYGNQYSISNLKALAYVVSGLNLNTKDISKVGNHLGTLDFMGEVLLKKRIIRFYHQFFYDKGALGHLANLADGLNGLVVENTASSSRNFSLKKILVEFFYSKDQAGEAGAKSTPSGPEYYYNHTTYQNGFSYLGESMGTPLITPARYARQAQASDPKNYFINNRVMACHIGVMGKLKKWNYILKATYSKNYGDYRTSGPDEQWYEGARFRQAFTYGKFSPVSQFSGYFETCRPLKNDFTIGVTCAIDCGQLLSNSIGGMIWLKKSW